MKAFGRGDVLIDGSCYLNTKVCGVRFVHSYYVSSRDPLYVAGYDLVTKAKLVVDSSNRCILSYHTSTPQGMPTCSSSSAIDASVHCFSTAVIDSILQDLTAADRWLQLCLIEHVFGISNATAYNDPYVLLPDPRTPLDSSGLRADVSPPAPILVDRPSRAPYFSLTDTSLADDTDMCLLDTANPGPVDDSSSRVYQVLLCRLTGFRTLCLNTSANYFGLLLKKHLLLVVHMTCYMAFVTS